MRFPINRKKRLFCFFLISIPIAAIIILWTTGSFSHVAYEFNPGDKFIFDIEQRTEVNINLAVLFEDVDSPSWDTSVNVTPLSKSYQVRLRAHLSLSTLHREKSRALVSYSLINPYLQLNINGRDDRYQAELSAQNLSKEVYADVSSQGGILAVYLDPEMDQYSQNLARYILAETQFVSPGGTFRLKNSWEAKEHDPNGQYIAKYERINHPEGQESLENLPNLKTFRKTKLSYSNPEPERKPNRFNPNKSILSTGSLVAFFNVHKGCLQSMSGSHSESMMISNKNVSQSKSSIQIRLLKKEILSLSELSHLQSQDAARRASVSPLPLSVSISEEEAIRIIDRSTLAKETVDSLLAELDKSEKKGDARNTTLFLKFKALVNLHPEVCGTLSLKLIIASPNSLPRHVISEALAVAGHSKAQAALVQTLRSCPSDLQFQSELIQKLSMVEQPTSLAESTLYEFAGDANNTATAGNATAGLGVMAYNLAKYDSIRSHKIVDWIIAQIQPSTHEQNLNLYLMALGNSGSVRALQILSKYLQHESLTIRSTVAASLRWIENERADDLLVKILEKDAESSVRNSAVFALSFRTPNQKTFKAQKKALMKDSSALVRLSILENFGKIQADYPEITQLLRHVAENDRSEEVKKLSARILSEYSQVSQ